MLELAGVLADTKATNAASNAEKERLQNIRQLADSVIEKINKRKAELQSPCTPEEICNRYREMFGEELAPEDAVRLFVKEYGNDSLIKANGQRILYIYDMDEAMNAVHCKILGADAAENQKKAERISVPAKNVQRRHYAAGYPAQLDGLLHLCAQPRLCDVRTV